MMKKIDWETPIVIDFETYYGDDWTIKKMTTEKYIRGEKFECIGLSIKVGNMPTHFYKKEIGIGILQTVLKNYPNSPVVSHNATFDAGILAFRYGIHPSVLVDTVTMAKLSGLDRVIGGSSLAKLSWYLFKIGVLTSVKGTEVHNMYGVHADAMSEAQWKAYGEYCKLDSDLCYAVYKYLMPLCPVDELLMASVSLQMWTKPMISADVTLLERHKQNLITERERVLDNLAGTFNFATREDMLSALRSKPKFVDMLEQLGVEVPTKWSEAKNELIPATAKTDKEFLALLEHPDRNVRALVETKLSVSSSIEMTRTETFLDVASRGLVPVPLRYASAHTGRYGGCFVAETIVCLKSKNPFDSSPYYANIVYATPDTLIWNGEEFVEHDGVICNGVQEVINYDGLCGTRGHKVFTSEGLVTLEYARDNGLPIIDCALPSDSSIFPIAGTRPKMNYADGAVVPVYDILNAGKDHKYMANGKLVHNSDKLNFQNLPKRSKDPVLRRALRAIDGHLWVAADSSQIEARLNAYISNQTDLVQLFIDGRDPYVDMATEIYGKSYDEIMALAKGDNATKEGKQMRNLGKEAVLACGYGMSANTFGYRMELAGNHQAAEMKDVIVNAYRRKNDRIVAFWRECDKVLDVLCRGGSMRFGGPNNDLFYATNMNFHSVTIPVIMMPNGTYLFYQNLRKEMDEQTGRLGFVYDQYDNGRFKPKRIWGSSLVENLCQCFAFVVLKWQALNIVNDGYQININVHDEWAGVYPKDKVKSAVLSYYRNMKRVPDYLPDGLLDCEVDIGINYADLHTVDSAYLEQANETI